MSPSRHFLPQVVASPVLTPLKGEDDIEDIDRLNLDDFYGEGRYPLRKPKPLPFYVDTPGHKEAVWRKHPFRNHEEVNFSGSLRKEHEIMKSLREMSATLVMIRLLADGVVSRWTRDERKRWSEERHEKMLAGIEQLPKGIGLSDVVLKPN
ncbi:unnamed protein product [Angiostrongylus costaricensis]|uniref:39S ribosomal protein L22, mitochondrial n=1 Tax=Angiostrongylus costaricensis TaxID=334426 RepID=A0A0R3PF28_ANGCS|nr:unnamed protein product [Angiostrongylus costaricensis]